jgi:hypothetical protein
MSWASFDSIEQDDTTVMGHICIRDVNRSNPGRELYILRCSCFYSVLPGVWPTSLPRPIFPTSRSSTISPDAKYFPRLLQLNNLHFTFFTSTKHASKSHAARGPRVGLSSTLVNFGTDGVREWVRSTRSDKKVKLISFMYYCCISWAVFIKVRSSVLCCFYYCCPATCGSQS